MRRLDAAGAAKESRTVSGLRRAAVQKALILVAVSALTALLFFPAITYFGFNYRAGDVAAVDIKSPVDIDLGYFSVKKGETVVREGEVLSDVDVNKLRAIVSAMKEKRLVVSTIGVFAFMMVLLSATYLFSSRNIRKFSKRPKDLLLMAAMFFGILLMLRFSDLASRILGEIFPFLPSNFFIYMFPVASGAMLARLFLNSETSLVFALVTALVAGLFVDFNLELSVYFLIGGVTAAMGVRHCIQRSTIIMAGLLVGLFNSLTLISIAAVKGGVTGAEPLFMVFAGFVNGIATSVVTVGVAPIFEMVFRYTTNIKLLELSRMDHPLLKELAVRAPGTYHHSIVIGTLVEAAAESINANPLLARVSAYYHDIGKLRMPLYFIENMRGENRHNKLTPSMSALIVTNHVKEGVEMARRYKLGQEIIDIIQQHHGTSLIRFFYQKARALERPHMHEVDEKDFRYPGPKPQTREAGLVMLADAIEAAGKTIQDPTPAKIRGMTQKIVNRIFTDGQLDECELTLKDLHSITNSFNRVLQGIYHQRIDYPEPAYISKRGAAFEGAHNRAESESKRAGEDKKGGRSNIRRLGV